MVALNKLKAKLNLLLSQGILARKSTGTHRSSEPADSRSQLHCQKRERKGNVNVLRLLLNAS